MDEILHFKDLLDEFGYPGTIVDPQEALRHIHNKYLALADYSSLFINLLKNNPDLFKEIFKSIIIFSHKFLFEDYLLNAGKFRNASDRYGGIIYFGPHDAKKGRVKFIGLSPIRIDNAINKLLDIFKPNDSNPISTAVKFYQNFVFIHPFYDGNGRIGRFIMSIYLVYFNLTINWEELDKKENKNKFITKLNRCHGLVGKPWYNSRLEELIRFFADFVIKNPDI